MHLKADLGGGDLRRFFYVMSMLVLRGALVNWTITVLGTVGSGYPLVISKCVY